MLYEDLAKANIDALKAHDKVARTILSIVYGKCKQASIDKQLNAKTLPDADCIHIIQKTIQELDEEMAGYVKLGRTDDAKNIEDQKNVIAKFLPKMLTIDEIRNEIEKLSDKSIPSVMKHFKANFNGLVDMGEVSKIAKEFN